MLSALVERKVCPGCHHEILTELYSCKFLKAPLSDYLVSYYQRNNIDFSFLGDNPYLINECTGCGLLFQRFILNPEYMAKFYGEMMTLPGDKPIHYPLQHYRYISDEIISIRRYFKNKELRVLDFGAGWGEWSLMAKAFGCEVYAAELSTEKLSYLSACGIKTVSYEQISKLQFDFINTEQVFEHVSAPGNLMSHLGNALSGGGILKISLPNGEKVKENLRTPNFFAERLSAVSLMPLQPIEHINAFNEQTLVTLAEQRNLFHEDIERLETLKEYSELTLKELIIPVYDAIKNPFRPIIRKYFRKVT